MCGCIGHEVCGYHTQVITDLIERLAEANAAGDDLAAAGLRSELHSYRPKSEIVYRSLAEQGN